MKYFKFYPADFLIGTQYLNVAEVGIYIKMLCYQWDKGYIPTDKNIYKSLFGYDMPNSLLSKFLITEDGSKYINERLNEQRNEAINKSNKLKENGTKGAQSRWSDRFLLGENEIPIDDRKIYFKIKNEIIFSTPSEYLNKWHKSYLEIQMMKLKLSPDLITSVLNDVYSLIDTDYTFYDFSSQNHLKNTFKSILNKIMLNRNNKDGKLSIHGSNSFD